MKTRAFIAVLTLLPGLAFAQGVKPGGLNTASISKALVPSTDLGVSLGSASHRWLTLFSGTLKDGNSTNRLIFLSSQGTIYTSAVPDGASAVAHFFNTSATLSTAGASLACFYNGGSAKQLCIDKDGKILGVFGATPQFIDMAYGSNGIQLRTGSAGGGDITFAEAGGNLTFHASVGGLTQGSVENPIPVVHAAQSGSPQAIEFGAGSANGSGTLAVSFATAFSVPPTDCECSDQHASPVGCGPAADPTTSGVTFQLGSGRGDTVRWHCFGVK